jgi:aminomethyltransferase
MKGHDLTIENKSEQLSIIAVQGPSAADIILNELKINISGMKSFSVKSNTFGGQNILISRTGYTGEDGFEIIIENKYAPSLFEMILQKGKSYGLLPCGLGARDTLRLESALPLYGHELDESHTPLQTNMAWSVKLNKEPDFIGKASLQNLSAAGFKDRIYGFEVLGRAIPRNGMLILEREKTVGYVTSGSFSPTLQKNIGLAYLSADHTIGSELSIQVRNRIEKINIIKIPFYKRNK